jgi:uncharacterized membrane protein
LDGTLHKLVTVVLLACLVGAVGLTVYLAVSPKVGERFTEFYVLGPSGKAYGYPTNLTLGESGKVILGVINHEYENVSYKIVVRLDNETISTIDDIVLSHGGKWEQEYVFTPQKAGERMKLEFILYRVGVEGPYRSLHLWVTVRPRR